MRIAAWSGPRNLSTAMMYAFAARGDCAVRDEPFYGPYLAATGLDHPMRAETIAAQGSDFGAVADGIGGDEAPHLYLKLMAHHMIDGAPLGWAEGMTHLYLIRHPARVVASYAAKRERPTLDDLGFARQVELFDRFGGVVIDSADIRADPPAMLRRLCAALGLPFRETMTAWAPGARAFDGPWAPHWYNAVHRSTGFAAAEGPLPELTGPLADLAEAAMPYYDRLATHRI
ncbi:HAD family hydrolase [Palleronia sediminis]|uniref:HAD family hydrolase n=1 Tax=Palleronia sediminis TaxID=2547833 RepID=A0A4R6AFG7_9RHOB|nr:HAD family hydrolase [Palleronia sediminis]TDL81168.1 HAD family hydrolase [Palleronia sediminis]